MRGNDRRYGARRRRLALRRAAVVALAVALLGGIAALALRRAPDDARAYAIPMTLPGETEAARDEPADATPDESVDTARVEPAGGGFEYLPVYRRADTDRKRIAITVDDCFQVENLRTIVDTASRAGGRLTLFPIGQNIEKPGMAALLRRSVFDLGFEIENHTWSHKRVFRLPETDMAQEIWRQGQAVNRALGVNYEQHFFRLMGGDGESDQRTHNYLAQLGFRGIANWSISGSDADMDMIRRALKPGAIFLFHTTDADTAKLRAFIPYAVAQGYELVTMNELLGYEANATSAYGEQTMPEPRAYAEDYRAHKTGDYAWSVVGMQDALRRMGYLTLDGPSTGYYGRQTAEAISAFQRAEGLEPTGVADEETQRRLAA